MRLVVNSRKTTSEVVILARTVIQVHNHLDRQLVAAEEHGLDFRLLWRGTSDCYMFSIFCLY